MDEKRIVHFLRTSLRSFWRRCLKRGFLTKTGITKLTRVKRFAFATRLPAGKWPSVRFAIQRTNKNSKLVAISR